MGSLRYVPTDLNCADDATTGLQAKVLGSEHRWFSRPEFLSLETSYSHCDELSILRDRGRLDRAELPFDTAQGHSIIFPTKITYPIVFCPSRQQLPTCVNLGTKSILDERWSVGGEELGQRMQ